MFRTDTRTISKKGGFTIPVQIRRALGIYDKTQVDIVESEDPDVLMLVKSRPHCICCGKVGNSLIKVNRTLLIRSIHVMFVQSALILLMLL